MKYRLAVLKATNEFILVGTRRKVVANKTYFQCRKRFKAAFSAPSPERKEYFREAHFVYYDV